MEELVSIFNSKFDVFIPKKDFKLYVYKNKADLVSKYVDRNLIKMKMDEPLRSEKYDDTFKFYLEEINMLSQTFNDTEPILVGVFGYRTDWIRIGENDVKLYHVEDINLVVEDMNEFYQNGLN